MPKHRTRLYQEGALSSCGFIFFVPPQCKHKPRIERLIKLEGGKVSPKFLSNSYGYLRKKSGFKTPRLVVLVDSYLEEHVSSFETKNTLVASTKFIEDTFRNGKMPNIHNYTLGKHRMRIDYTSEDDQNIEKFVEARKDEFGGHVMGNRIWREAEKEGITQHSWQSMRTRYKSVLSPQKTKSKSKHLQKVFFELSQDSGFSPVVVAHALYIHEGNIDPALRYLGLQ
eukprot:gb/GECH01011792.1/.p1 GENE.gb/GECH01011792.1/~~gb/GECH01011792.1/.p1  ORF type:complete len:226 (+),score=36.49 gb/GECH01011792.1/:1-678(+)